jgi:hypothetical protein
MGSKSEKGDQTELTVVFERKRLIARPMEEKELAAHSSTQATPVIPLITEVLLFTERHGTLQGAGISDVDANEIIEAIMNEGLIAHGDKRGYELTSTGHKWIITYGKDQRKGSRRPFFALQSGALPDECAKLSGG